MRRNKGALKRIAKDNPKASDTKTLRREYQPRFCNVVMDQGRQGKSRAQIATYLGVTRKRLKQWEAAHEDFREAMEIAEDRALAYLEGLAIKGLKLKHFQSALLNKLLASRAPETYGDRQKLEIEEAPLTVITRRVVDPGGNVLEERAYSKGAPVIENDE
jgi:hypothetical protein